MTEKRFYIFVKAFYPNTRLIMFNASVGMHKKKQTMAKYQSQKINFTVVIVYRSEKAILSLPVNYILFWFNQKYKCQNQLKHH